MVINASQLLFLDIIKLTFIPVIIAIVRKCIQLSLHRFLQYRQIKHFTLLPLSLFLNTLLTLYPAKYKNWPNPYQHHRAHSMKNVSKWSPQDESVVRQAQRLTPLRELHMRSWVVRATHFWYRSPDHTAQVENAFHIATGKRSVRLIILLIKTLHNAFCTLDREN